MNVVLFEDPGVAQLEPITLGRPAYAITCGTLRLLDLVSDVGQVWAVVRPYLRDLQQAEYPDVRPFDGRSLGAGSLWVNARLVPSGAVRKALEELAQSRRPAVLTCGGQLAAAWLAEPPAAQPEGDDLQSIAAQLSARLESLPRHEHADLALLQWPHEILQWHGQLIGSSLLWRVQRQEFQQLADGVFAAAGASLASHVATDTRCGPVVIDAGASVAPFTVLEGPVYIGPDARVGPHAVLRRGVYLGRGARAGGEVDASIIESFSNKQHCGYLGHSYLGSWVNLGAGTSTSNLKNTYGPISVDYRGRRTATGMQFLGCIVGDFVKTAINTSIFTGKLIGCCSMVYGWVTENVPSFTNYAKTFHQVTELRPDVMAEVQKRMFLRRGFEQQAYHIQLLRDLFAATGDQRRLPDRPPSF